MRHRIAFDRWPAAKSDPIRGEPIVARLCHTPIKDLGVSRMRLALKALIQSQSATGRIRGGEPGAIAPEN